MQKTNFFVLLVLLFSALVITSFKKPIKSLTPYAAGKTVACGPTFTFVNYTSYPVTKIALHSSGQLIEIFNPTFPYYLPGPLNGGNYTIVVHFDPNASGSGVIEAYNASTNTFITSETYDIPHLSPIPFLTSCSDYRIEIH